MTRHGRCSSPRALALRPRQYLLDMSQGRFSDPPLSPEDDWFAEPEAPRAVGREERREPPPSRPVPQHPEPPGGGRDRRILVAAAAGAVILLVVGVLVARALTGSDGGGEATTSLPTTTPTTTQTTTTPTTTPTTPTTTTPTTGAPTTLPEGVKLRRGDESEDVRQVQAALVELGYSTGGVDGKFGPATEQAVRAFQKSAGLTEDGVVGDATLAALSAALNER